MADPMEVKRLKSLVRRYRVLVSRLVNEGNEYTGGMDCPFCSGYVDYESANYREDQTVKHARICPTHQAKKLAAEKI
jgi:hypothetical protein